MRQGQQNRRGRGRNNNNNRKSQNPLMRSFESSGPDVKIRGTPSHIAEKYITLARDALSSGDPVLAENYLQHAEHYNRIILGYREQMAQQGGMDPMGNGAARTHSLAGPEGVDDEFSDEEGDEFGGGQQPQVVGQGNQPDSQQPFQQQPPRNFDNNQNRYDNRPPRHERYNNNRHDRNDRGDGQRFDRGDRGDRQDRQDFRGDRGDRNDRGDRYEQRNGSGGEGRYRDDRRPHNGNGEGHNQQGEGGYRRRERYQGPNSGNSHGNGGDREHANGGFQSSVSAVAPSPAVEREQHAPAPQAAAPAPIEQQEQPAFLRRPVRRPRREEPVVEAPAVPPAANEDSE